MDVSSGTSVEGLRSEPPDDQATVRRSLLGLTVVTGVVDAVSFLGLGHIFTANMTGNVVFLGFAMAGGGGVSPVRSMVALGAFACGGIFGGRVANVRDRSPAHSLLTAMWLEGLLLVVAVAIALRGAPAVSPGAAYSVIVVTAVAMGLRNAVVRKLGVPDLTTTVLTMTITGLAGDSRLAGGDGGRTRTRVLAIAAMCAGAFAGAVLLNKFGFAVALGAATLVVVASACVQSISHRGK